MFIRTISVAQVLLYFAAGLLFSGAWLLATGDEPPLWARMVSIVVTVVAIGPAERALARRSARRKARRQEAPLPG
ncbi:hypothetical protein [Streptomyces sp. NBC_01264]|uniref:hypothetical protein n=1 Tax=Streptomyces sp. NBC_01264 TaxID=2903804 RepID=UPI0022554006|nr:hypothetical protein [Streptomyces sp. NBC_01264]MCX4784133.1 hypothetical protein [Streptomyces sp. NBC_01264]